MKTCLVTGGAGFIGSHLVERLLPRYRVICVDNISSGSRENIKLFLKNKNFEFIEHDIKKELKVNRGVDYIFHLASRASPVDFKKYPIDILLTNSLGTLNMLELAKSKSARMLFASTSEVYGDPKKHPQSETYWGNVNCIGPRGCYDESKRFGEALCMAYYRKRGVDVRIARIFNTYGPRMRAADGRVTPNFITQAISGEPITVYGDGKQTRSFCYVLDMVRGLEKLMFKERLGSEVINLGSPKETKIIEFAKIIKSITGSDSKIVFQPLPENDPVKRRPDIRKAKKLLGWEPEVGLKEGLTKTIDWFKANY